MHFQSFLTAIVAVGMGISPVLALPEAIAEGAPGLTERATGCISGGKRAGSHCEAGNVGKNACSNDNTAKMVCKGATPQWNIIKSCNCSYCECV